eukprot:TRINITY_DN7720_c0_g1_i1.p1 TRINITY_DN7720_c0_g1~~TRINITY_DN7720_c0_g1_i1.p1  ORF type:complete len:519 (-),score=96.81 TRINITY_DN7720_c0_g1_i1:307-1863(-)
MTSTDRAELQQWFADSTPPRADQRATPASAMRVVTAFVATFGRSFAAGYGLRVLLRLIPLLLKGAKALRGANSASKHATKAISKSIAGAKPPLLHEIFAILKHPTQVRFGLFCGAYIAIYKTLLEATRHWAVRPPHYLPPEPIAPANDAYAPFSRRTPSLMDLKSRALEPYEPSLVRLGQKRENKVYSDLATMRGLVFGAVAGLAILLVPGPTRVSISLFFTVRALEVVARYFARTEIVPSVYNADVFVMMLASAQVLWAWLFKPDALDPGYGRFLDIHGGKHKAVIRAIQSFIYSQPISHVESLNKLLQPHGRLLNPASPSLCCDVLHPGHSSCIRGQLSFFNESYRRSIPVYLPVYLAPMLIFHYRSLLKDPLGTITRSMTGVARSSLFLSCYCTFAWSALCFCRQVLGWKNDKIGLVAGFAAGSALWFEKKGRRIELAMYVMMHAIETFHRCCVDWKVYRPVRYGEVFLFSLASGVILQAYLRHPELLSSTYRSVLNRVVGQAGTDTKITDARHE